MNIGQDIRFALRTMRKAPGFTLVAILTLALGIGANTAIFTVVNAVFFNPIPVTDAGRLVQLFTTDQRNKTALQSFLPISFPNGDDIRHRAQSFSDVALFTGAPVSMTINGQPEQLFAQLASGNYFDVLGVRAEVGRTFRPDEDAQPGAGPVIVLSHGLWERKFASNPNVIGQTVLLNGQGFSIIGIAPRGFQGTAVLGGPAVWVPMSMHDQVLSGLFKRFFNERRFLGFSVIGRLNPGVSLERANSELQTIGSGLEKEFPIPNKSRSFTGLSLLATTINPNARGTFTTAGTVMMIVVGLILLIACANIANLLLARAAGRRREISVRLALGASRSRIVTQLLTESSMLALAGGALGLGVAVLGRNLLWQFRPPFLLQSDLSLALDAKVLLFTMLTALLTGMIFGLIPALQASRPDLVSELKERVGSAASSGSWFSWRSVFVGAQVMFSLVALVGSGLFLMSLHNAQQTDTGFDTHNLAMISFDVGSLNYDPPRVKEFQRRVLEAAQAVPGIKSATLSSNVPLFGGGFGRSVFPEGLEGSKDRNGVLVTIDSVANDYLPTMGIPLLRGQGFDNAVREGSPRVAVINETAAKRFWPNEDAVGRRFKFFGDETWTQVIGVARDAKYNSLGEDPTPYMYLPLVQNPSPAVTLFVRSNADPQTTLGSVRSHVQELDRNLPLTNVWPIGEVISQALWPARFSAGLLAIFASIAVLLCAIGIYGVVGYTVGQRVREIGIRMALGAQPGSVVLMVVRQSAVTLLIGLAVGLATSFLLAWVFATRLTDVLVGVKVTSPIPFIATALLLALIGLLASYIPARRAAKVNPIVALHYE
jgi:putative ABC transport system permease protein